MIFRIGKKWSDKEETDLFRALHYVCKLANTKAKIARSFSGYVLAHNGEVKTTDGYRIHALAGIFFLSGSYRVVKCTKSLIELLPADQEIKWPNWSILDGEKTEIKIKHDYVDFQSKSLIIKDILTETNQYANLGYLSDAVLHGYVHKLHTNSTGNQIILSIEELKVSATIMAMNS